MQFFYSLLMTVLWVVVLWRLQGLCDKEAFKKLFGVVLNVALAAIFIQIVFGPVYRNLWARTLSDRWILESPEYVMVATIVSACVSAMPQNQLKTLMVAIVILVFIVVPAKLFRRSLTAYVLIRVLPGKTEQVRKTLLAADIFSAVLYGDYDVLVKVEVPGRVSPKPGDTFSDERELGELAALVQHQIRCMKEGITETQTLLDFSDFVSIPNDDEERLSRR